MDDDVICIEAIETKPLIIDAEEMIPVAAIHQNGIVIEDIKVQPLPETVDFEPAPESEPTNLYTFIDILDLDDPRYLELSAVRELPDEHLQSEAIHRCFVCPSRFRAVEPLRHHMKLHASVVCAKCGEAFFKTVERDWHMRAVHGEDREFRQQMGSMFFCRFCAVLGFQTMEEACEHLTVYHAESVETVPCPVKEEDDDVVEILTPKEEQETFLVCGDSDSKPENWKYYCNSCDVYIIGQSFNELHNQYHNNPKPTMKNQSYACQNCPKTFKSRLVYSEHVKEHALKKIDDNNLLCLLCNRKFATETGIKQHIHAQHVRKPLGNQSCQYCSQTFPDTKKLWKHKWTAHRVMLGYKCESCGQQFSTSRARTKHKVEAHEQDLEYRRRMCRPCYILFDTVEELQEHEESVHRKTCA